MICRFSSWLLVAVVLTACASAQEPIRNFSAVPTGATPNLTLEQVGAAITKGGVAAGWQMSPIKPGHIIGTYRIRHHLAVVDVTYDTAKYNITFQHGDAGLRYDGQTIHQQYNIWVSELERVIRAHVNAL